MVNQFTKIIVQTIALVATRLSGFLGRQKAVHAPAFQIAFPNAAVMMICHFCDFFKRHFFAFVFNFNKTWHVPSVFNLFLFRCPSDVSGFVMPVAINSVEGIFQTWSFSDFGKKIFKSFKLKFNPTSAIKRKTNIVWVVASLFRRAIRRVFNGTTSAVRYIGESSFMTFKTGASLTFRTQFIFVPSLLIKIGCWFRKLAFRTAFDSFSLQVIYCTLQCFNRIAKSFKRSIAIVTKQVPLGRLLADKTFWGYSSVSHLLSKFLLENNLIRSFKLFAQLSRPFFILPRNIFNFNNLEMV